MRQTPTLRSLQLRALAILAVLGALAMSMSACGGADTPPANTAGSPDKLALATLDQIVQGDNAAATAHFDQTMADMLSAPALGQAWITYQQLLGAYQSHGDPQDVQRGELTVVNVPLQMEHAPGQFRLTVHPDGTVAGLYFLKEGVPVP
ncbi:hypothetical protein DE4585_04088 [Mycobacteroides salmoniphilum]|uniref:DUF3887 domain-containing protein n=1 Tax=Mycobacteroides salmoniphilum TaxID=404941 RepID=A0A4R8RUS0_9MYCO|nr:DUF3887 domain-containing protein [Mycobacteroides salmoniphilum]TDZ78252.1 hypothetical protein DE4585_04088 [Mycobacteroides salmoniphilum]